MAPIPRLAKENVMKKLAFLSALLAAASLPTSVQAQEMPPGSYFGVSILSAHTQAVRSFASAIGGEGDSKTAGGKLYSGVLWGNWGLEAGIYHLGKFKVASAGATSDEFETQAVSVSGVYTAPVGASGSISLRAGGARVSSEYTCLAACLGIASGVKTSTVLLTGFGLGWRLSPRFTLRADFERFAEVEHVTGAGNIKSPYEVGSLGVQFNF